MATRLATGGLGTASAQVGAPPNYQEDYYTRQKYFVPGSPLAIAAPYSPPPPGVTNYPQYPGYQADQAAQDDYMRQMQAYNQQYQNQVSAQNTAYDQQVQDYNNQLAAYNSRQQEAQVSAQKAQQDWINQQQQQAANVGYQRSAYGGPESYATPGNVIAPSGAPYQTATPYLSVGSPLGMGIEYPQLPAPAVSIPQSERQGYQRATSGNALATPGNVVSPAFKPKNLMEELIGAPYTGVRTPVPKAWQNIVGEAGSQTTREQLDLSAGRKPLTNMLGWDKTRPPDTLTTKGIGLKPEGYGNTLRAATKEQLIANGVVVVDATGRQFFNQGAYKGLPAERWSGDQAWITNQVATGKWSLAWANEYARLIGLDANIKPAIAQKLVSARQPTAQQLKQAAAVTAPRYGNSGYGSSGYSPYSGYGSSGYGSGATTPDTSNLPGWLQAWQKMRI